MAYHHYDPNQPRVPAGHDGAGQWTDGIPAPLSQLEALFNHRRGGDRHEEPVRLAFRDRKKGPAALDWVISRLPPKYQRLVRAAQAAYLYLSPHDNADQRKVLEFKTYKFRRNDDGSFVFEGEQTLTEDEIKKKCDEFEQIQQLADRAFKEVTKKQPGLRGRALGEAVHRLVKQWIDDDSELKKVGAEITLAKEDNDTKNVYTNARNTVRFDVINKVNDETVCIDDIKTSKGFDYKRMRELVGAAGKKYPDVKEFILTAIWPKGTPLAKQKGKGQTLHGQ